MRLQKNLKKDEYHPDHCLAPHRKKEGNFQKTELGRKSSIFRKAPRKQKQSCVFVPSTV